MAVANKGNVSEGILGAALIAKYAARASGRIQKVGASDVTKVLTAMKSIRISSGFKNVTEFKYDVGNSARDKITLSLKLGTAMFKDLLNPRNWTELSPLINSACSYVNSKSIEDAAEAYFANNINNVLSIEVDGISNNTSTKADLIIKNDGVTVTAISLKSGAKQVGQVGGDTFTTFVRLFLGGPHPRTGAFEPGLGLKVNDKKLEQEFERRRGIVKTKDKLQDATKYIYKYAADLMNRESKDRLIRNLETFLQFHTTRHDDKLILVVLENKVKGAHKSLNPARLHRGLQSLKSIKAVYKDGEFPTILIYEGSTPAQTLYSKNTLLGIRVKWDSRDGGQIYNVVEKGALFEELLAE